MIGRPGRRRGVSDHSEDFTAFVHSTGTQLYRTALLLTGDHHLAEDLTQAAYAKTYAAWARVSRADNPVAYARTIVVNTFLSHRRLRRNGELPTDAVPERAGDAPDPTTRLDLLAAMRMLPATDRAILVARYWEDRSVSETATDLGLSDGAVRTRAKRALDRIRPHLTHLSAERTTS